MYFCNAEEFFPNALCEKKKPKHLARFRSLTFIEKDFQYILLQVANAYLLKYSVGNLVGRYRLKAEE